MQDRETDNRKATHAAQYSITGMVSDTIPEASQAS